MNTSHQIVFGDARKMSRLSDKSVHLIITSPPYWQLKDYGVSDQIGFDDSYESYVNNLNLVWQECHRVLHDGCRLCINIGDQFARSVYYGRYKVIPIRTEIIRFCETIGFDFMGSIIWQKVTTCNTTGGATIMGSFPYPRNGIVKIDYEFILLFKKHGQAPKIDSRIKSESEMSQEEWNTYFSGHWNFPGERQNGHIAMFPEELPKRLIKMFSFIGETVLDPFAGSGTTSLAAINLSRNSVGYEINPSFREVMLQKFQPAASLFKAADIQFFSDDTRIDGNAFESLPYVFKDPLLLNKKVDPRRLHFGSKVSGNEKPNDSYVKVTNVISGNKIAINNDIVVRLLGVAPRAGMEDEARRFLTDKVLGKQVYLKYDAVKYDTDNNLLAYLYLKNKTFINLHLIKHGFAIVDVEYEMSSNTLARYGGG